MHSSRPILVVVRDAARRMALDRALAERFDVTTAENVADALGRARTLQPLAIVLDFPFPATSAGGGSRCLSTLLKEDRATRDIPVVAYSGWDFARTRSKAAEYGCAAFVSHEAGERAILEALAPLVQGRASRSVV